MTETDRPDPDTVDTAPTAQSILDREPTVESVVEAVAEGTDRDPEAIRRSLDPFAEDDVLTAEAVEETVSDVSKILATAETRVDLAALDADDARAAAAAVTDLDVVDARLRGFDDRLAALERRTDELGRSVGAAPDELETPSALHRSAVELRETAADAQRVVRVADDLASDLEAFESWLSSPDRRTEELAADVEALEEALVDLSSVADRIDERTAADEEGPDVDEEGAFETDGEEWTSETDGETSHAAEWADATVRARVLELLVADLRAEEDDIRTWAARENASVPESLRRRIDAADRRLSMLSTTLSDLAAPDWHDRFAERLAATDRALARFDPPVAWGRVREEMAEPTA
ncbi:halo transducer protein [Halopenitus salinus]|uniref:Halo transducer protein n=1 Tax=Halopenitus salinus TaxID=1198295 RepID=A0ABD5UTW2_9EURY